MLTFEEFTKKQQSGDPALNRDNFRVMTQLMHKASIEYLGTWKHNELSGKFMDFSDTFSTYSTDILPEETKRRKFHKLAEFGEFLKGDDASGVPNIARLASASKKADPNFDLFGMLSTLNDGLGLGLDMNSLREKSNQVPVEEAEADDVDKNGFEAENDGDKLGDDSVDEKDDKLDEADDDELDEADDELDEEEEVEPDIDESKTLTAKSDVVGTRTAADHIESLRDNGFPQKNPEELSENDKEIYTDRFLKIMAARELADSVRGSKAKLVATKLSADDINRRALEMKQNGTFSRFMDKLKEDPKLMKAAVSAAGKGHGGGLDDMFRDYVKNQNAGELRNDGILKRYMPTVKERIEILQKQYGKQQGLLKDLADVEKDLTKLQKGGSEKKIEATEEKKDKIEEELESGSTKEKIAAEIIQLRNLSHAVKGKKSSLDKPVPVASASEVETLCSKVDAMGSFEDPVLSDPEVTKLILSGHGGDMAEKARTLANEKLNTDYRDDRLNLATYNGNTIGQRLKDLRRSAGKLSEEIGKRTKNNGEGMGALMKQGVDLLAETILLDGRVRDPQTGDIMKDQLLTEVPWNTVDKVLAGNPENNPTFNGMFGNLSPNKMIEVLGELSANGHDEFVTDLAMQKASEKVEAEPVEEDIELDPLDTAVDYGKGGKEKPIGGAEPGPQM